MKSHFVVTTLLTVSVAIVIQNDESAVNDVEEFNANHILQDYVVGNHYKFSDDSVVNRAQAHAAGRSLLPSISFNCGVCTRYRIESDGKWTCVAYKNSCTGFTGDESGGGGSFRRSLTESTPEDGAVMTDGADD
ncbi:hypothetical protein FOZ60_000693 [Perkinsus olseni]|uniref:Uncharacterized protein n=1 Tax=Perkinsus olseni TaxID=32597 RepID=A0A7J6SAY8_PEROL|nr:hypothetical protein FOZ60_000693 [Perkinsus olseni]KAF4730078.1 hypothetical protein FOZ62_022255 [Perkinsus olseni]